MLDGLRQKMEKSPAVGYAIAAGVVVLAIIAFFVMQEEPPKARTRVDGVYYLDLESNKFFRGESRAVPPIKSPDGNESVQAFVFACEGKCDDQANFIISYLVKYSDDAKKLMEKKSSGGALSSDEEKQIEQGHMIGTPDGKTWHVSRSKPAGKLLNGDGLQGKCPGKIRVCNPAPVDAG